MSISGSTVNSGNRQQANSSLEFFSAPRGAEARSDLRRIMTEPYLSTVIEEAEHVAEQHDQVARTTDNQAHEYLRYAVLRVLEELNQLV